MKPIRKCGKCPTRLPMKYVTKKSKIKSPTACASNHYHFQQDSLCNDDSDGRCDVKLVSTEKDDRDELKCRLCTNEWNKGESKYCCRRSDCHNIFCERCVKKDKTKRSSKRRHESFASTKHKKSSCEKSDDEKTQSETDDDYQQTTTPSTTESRSASESSSNHNHNHNKSDKNESETETSSATSSEFRNIVKKKSHFSTKQVAIRTKFNYMDTDESMTDNDSICSNKKRKMSDSKCEEDEPPHKKMKSSHDKKESLGKTIKELIDTKNEHIDCYKKQMEKYKAIALKQRTELKIVKAEGMKCVQIINGLRRERAVYKEKLEKLIDFFNEVVEQNNEQKEEIAQNHTDEGNKNNEERERSIEDGEIIEHDDDIKTNAVNTNNQPLRKRRNRNKSLVAQ